MSRRFHDMRITRDQWTAGDAIAASVAFLVGLLALIGAIALLASQAKAWDGPQSDPAVGAWYRSLMQPDNPYISCCGEADAYWADEVHVDGDKVFAIITDTRDDGLLGRQHVAPGTRIEIPKHKYKFDRGNPTGHNILFLSSDLRVYCFVQGSGT